MGRVIRAAHTGASVIPKLVFDARREATRIVEAARERAQTLQAEAITEGLARGRAEAAATLFDLAQLRARTLAAAEESAVQAALLIAKRLVGDACAASTQPAATLVAAQLARVRRAHDIVVHVAPQDAAAVRATVDARARELGIESRVELREDTAITPGGCRVVSSLGELDARVETRIAYFAAALRGATK